MFIVVEVISLADLRRTEVGRGPISTGKSTAVRLTEHSSQSDDQRLHFFLHSKRPCGVNVLTKVQVNLQAAEALARTMHVKLTVFPRLSSWWEVGLNAPSPRIPLSDLGL